MSKKFNDTLRQLLLEKNKPIDIFALVDQALAIRPLKKDKYLIGQELYELSKHGESYFVIEEYPSFKLQSYSNIPNLPTKGYLSAAFKLLFPSRAYIELRALSQKARNNKLLGGIQSDVAEYWMYAKLNEHKKIFAQKGALNIGLMEWRIKKEEPESPESDKANAHTASVAELKGRARWEVFKRDSWKCVACGRNSHDGAKLQVDHIIPRSRGGQNSLDNYQTLCETCNIGKGNKDATDLRNKG